MLRSHGRINALCEFGVRSGGAGTTDTDMREQVNYGESYPCAVCYMSAQGGSEGAEKPRRDGTYCADKALVKQDTSLK